MANFNHTSNSKMERKPFKILTCKDISAEGCIIPSMYVSGKEITDK